MYKTKIIIRHLIITTLLVLGFCKPANIQAQNTNQKLEISESEYPKQIGFVNDFENIFTADEIKFLNNLLVYYQKNSNKDVAVITIGSIPEGMEFDDYAIKMSENWKVGRNNDGNGLTIIFSKSLKRVRISTTDKTQYHLSDEFCNLVTNQYMIPEFKKEKYYDGILLGLNELVREWK